MAEGPKEITERHPMTQPANKDSLLALRDQLLRMHDKDAAAAADNLIDLLSRNEHEAQEADAIEWNRMVTEMRGGL